MWLSFRIKFFIVFIGSIFFTEDLLSQNYNQLDSLRVEQNLYAIDIDGNGNVDALTDGLLILRAMFGLTGDALISDTIGAGATVTSSLDIETKITNINGVLDIDNNGFVDPLSDGLLILRYLFGIRGSLLIAGVVGPDSERSDADSIVGYLENLNAPIPEFISSNSFEVEENQKEIVIQFKPEIFEKAFQNLEELKLIKQLLELSKKGIVFEGSIKEDIGLRMEGLQYESRIDSFLTFIKILYDLAKEKSKKILNAEGYAFISSPNENKRLKTIFNYIRDHFMERIVLEEISDQVFMTPQSFCRFFKNSTSKTFTTFLNEYRINHATKLLSETDADIKTICYESGFNNFSNFYRNFKKITKMTPNNYRDEILESLKND